MNSSGDNPKSPYGTALVKSVGVLNALADFPEGLGVSDVARRSGLNKGTAYKLLETLQSLGWVSKRDGNYTLGVGLLRLARAAAEQMDVAKLANPDLKTLNLATGETVHLGVEDDGRVVYVAKLESPHAVRMYSSVGKSAPLHCTGIGKALLSTFSEARLQTYIRTTTRDRYTANTLVEASELLTDIEEIRKRGYSLDDGEHETDVRCISVPLMRSGRVYGAVSVSAPIYRFGEDCIELWLPHLRDCCERILGKLDAFAK